MYIYINLQAYRFILLYLYITFLNIKQYFLVHIENYNFKFHSKKKLYQYNSNILIKKEYLNMEQEIDKIGFFGTIITELKLGFKDIALQKEIIFLSKVISVALYLDKAITIREIKEAKKIIKDEMGDDWKITWDNILIYIEKYKDDETKWLFTKNKEEVFDKIVDEKRYLYAKYLINILKADGINEEERKYFEKFRNLVQKHDELLASKGLS